MKDSLGKRMKENYEDRYRFYLPRRIPCIIRVDGKAFHTYTKDFERPFDNSLLLAMTHAAKEMASEIQGFKLAYLQSDECSILVTDYDQVSTSAWFDYNKSKIETVTASGFTALFNARIRLSRVLHGQEQPLLALFDARAFSMPREEIANYFLWRSKDWERNSISMYCREHFSHSQLNNKSRQEQHDMLHSIGKNWTTDLEPCWRNGSWIVNTGKEIEVKHDITPVYSIIEELIKPLITEKPEHVD